MVSYKAECTSQPSNPTVRYLPQRNENTSHSYLYSYVHSFIHLNSKLNTNPLIGKWINCGICIKYNTPCQTDTYNMTEYLKHSIKKPGKKYTHTHTRKHIDE